jgi:hypothetical protein
MQSPNGKDTDNDANAQREHIRKHAIKAAFQAVKME